MSATADRIAGLVAPLLEDPQLLAESTPGGPAVELYDVEYEGGVLRIVLDRPGGLDVALLAKVTRSISSALDDADTIDASYTLEVSSPGIERRLRTPAHFAAAVGDQVQVKIRPGTGGERRTTGTLIDADDARIVVTADDGATRTILIDDITRAQVHKDWSPPPKPGAKRATTKNEPTTRSETTS